MWRVKSQREESILKWRRWNQMFIEGWFLPLTPQVAAMKATGKKDSQMLRNLISAWYMPDAIP